MTIQPDPNRHEASRAAFEETRRPAVRQRESTGEYASPLVNEKWLTWCSALDWRDEQVCGWEVNETEYGIRFYADCGHDHTPNYKSEEYKFCSGCGRRVKIQAKNGGAKAGGA